MTGGIQSPVIVFAPHPDDETLGAGGLMAQAVASGADVHVVLMTSGDGFREDAARYYLSFDISPEEYIHMGYERQTEAVEALGHLGVSRDHVHFLGFPDGGLARLWLEAWSGTPWVSETTRVGQVPYITDVVEPSAPYVGARLLQLLIRLLTQIRPRLVVMPTTFDQHPDHWMTNVFATAAVREWETQAGLAEPLERWGYLVHWNAWPLPVAYRPHLPTEPPENLRQPTGLKWVELSVDTRQAEQKRQALMAYESQVELIKPFMLAFVRRSEIFLLESQWTETSRIVVPPPDRLAKLLGRVNPLKGAAWGRIGDHLEVTVDFDRPPTASMALEVSLHGIGTGVHRVWRVTPEDPNSSVTGRQWRLSWPVSWYDGARELLAGIQLKRGAQEVGRLPFRLWEGL